jgi:hypothetical protein
VRVSVRRKKSRNGASSYELKKCCSITQPYEARVVRLVDSEESIQQKHPGDYKTCKVRPMELDAEVQASGGLLA